MDVFEAIRTVLAVRSYRNEPIPEEIVRKILEAGRLSASAKNAQPWHFVVVRDGETIRELGRLVVTGPYIAEAPLAIVVAVEKTMFGLSDGSRAIQNMVLAAWAEGVGSNWAGGPGMDHVKERLGIPAELDVVAVLPFGYPAQAAGAGKKTRKPLMEVASSERYGQPFV